MKTPEEKRAFLAHVAAADICNRFATHYIDVHCEAGPWGTKHLEDVASIIEVQMAQCYVDALNHAVNLCAGVSPRCGKLKDRAIRDCIRLIQAEVERLTA